MTNVRSRFNDWMFKALFFIITVSLMSLTANGVLAADLTKVSVTLDPESFTYDGSIQKPTVTVTDNESTPPAVIPNTELDIKYKNSKGAEVDPTDAGDFTIEIKPAQGSTHTGEKTVSYTIEQKSLDDSDISATVEGSYTYNGEAIKPGASDIKVKKGEVPLKFGTDYEIDDSSYTNNINAGTATFKIRGIGNYNKEKTVSYTINQADLSKATIDIEPQEYTGSKIEPKNVGKETPINFSGMGRLTEGKDYELTYPGENINVGEGTVKITGNGNYTGFKDVTFKITAKELSADMIADIPDQAYTGSEIKPTVTLSDGSALPEGLDVKYSDNTEVSKDNKLAKVTISSAKEGGNYSGSAEKTFKIVAKKLAESMVSTTGDKIYTGSEIKVKDAIAVTDTIDGKKVTLTEGTDYEIEAPSNLKDVGTVKAKVIGKGNYSGEVEKTFNITPATVTLSDLSASRIIYGESLAESKITGKALDGEKEIKGTIEFVNPSIKPELKDHANPADMEIEADVIFKSEDGNYEAQGTVPVAVAYWGEPTLNNGIMNWVSKNGTTSTKVQASGISWLKEDSENSFTWYGIENSLKKDGTLLFEPGSKFWVRWLSKSDSDWAEEYAKIDQKYKEDVDNDRLYIFKMGITAPDGTEYEKLGTYIDASGNEQKYLANVYIQLGSDWDERDIRSMCILTGEDEKIGVSYVNSIPSAPIAGRFARLEVPHFSTWGLYDSLYSDLGSLYDTASAKSVDSSTTSKASSGTTASKNSTSTGASTSGSGTSYGSLNLYKSTGEDKYSSMMPMILPIVLFVLLYGKKKVNKDKDL